MKIRYAKNLITGAVDMQNGGEEGNQLHLDCLVSNMIGDGASGLTPSDVETGWEEKSIVEGWVAQHEIDKVTPMEAWLRSIAETDFQMPRHMEDMITSNSSFVIPAEVKKRYDEKVALRATKP
jgi:hypothetical protein